MKLTVFAKFFCTICLLMFAHIANATTIFSATLGGDQEVPANASTASGSATATLTGMAGSYVLSYEINYTGLSAPIIDAAGGGHFHNASAGSNGAVVHLFDTTIPFLGTTSGSIIGDWRFDDGFNPLTDALAAQLVQGNIYINLHTAAIQSGEIRGQLIPEPTVWLLLATGLILLIKRKDRR